MTMRKVLLFVTVAVFCTASLAYGAGHFCGKIGWYEDQTGSDCNLNIQGGVGMTAWLVHSGMTNVEGVVFKTPIPDCVDWSYSAITTWGPAPFDPMTDTPWLTIGGPDWEWSFAYQQCITGTIVLAKFDGLTMSGVDCCAFPVLPGEFFGFLCSPCGEAAVYWNLGVIAYLDSNGGVACPCELPVAADESTWGKVKALYADE
jgi:hypothetical protein